MPQKTSKSEIVSVSLPKSLAEALRSATEQAGGSRSKLVQEAIEQYLWFKDWQDVQAYGVEQGRMLGIRPEDISRLIDEYRREAKKATRRR
ncbi:MAG: hypothetical protein COT71_01960 [Candidatus Andersenbacteria bacterium CG10_big_fil_rev_8_21_14_0_10_54_11]|uniref:Ribbon-helix-helix protein CopG domain-containing protein n=1 Tax=Candidatus Andersenbacteria bacterium CG10_big_fil_rev_8_21_14_0_10_54_11 TaxID=1974485 RepID=A0A2M6WZM8_9BACT|nr:MAG: hypothetical protein COT71_01960 [Candidatus Andersenbacteria bacterium CG10_big_fil_rev_8_21_14_0_10_54_11]